MTGFSDFNRKFPLILAAISVFMNSLNFMLNSADQLSMKFKQKKSFITSRPGLTKIDLGSYRCLLEV